MFSVSLAPLASTCIYRALPGNCPALSGRHRCWSVLGRARSWTLLLMSSFQLRFFCDPWQGFSTKGWVPMSWVISGQKPCWIMAQVCTSITLVSRGGSSCVQGLCLPASPPWAEPGCRQGRDGPGSGPAWSRTHHKSRGGCSAPL